MSVCRLVFVHYQGKEVLPLKAGPRARQEIGRVEMVRMRHTTCAQPSAIALTITLITPIYCLPSSSSPSSSSTKKVLLTLILALHLILTFTLIVNLALTLHPHAHRFQRKGGKDHLIVASHWNWIYSNLLKSFVNINACRFGLSNEWAWWLRITVHLKLGCYLCSACWDTKGWN